MTEQFYNFCFDRKNKGYYYLKQTADRLLSKTQFLLETGELYTNTFELVLKGDKVTAYRYKDGNWIDFKSRSETHYPTSAYPLYLSKALYDPYHFIAVSEHNNAILGKAVLEVNGDELIETVKGDITRRFVMQGNTPILIDWGGPISTLCQNVQEAVEGSGLKVAEHG